MTYVSNHAQECKKYLGKEYWEVHKFLDQYSNIFPPDIFVDYHRTFFHNSYGVEIIYSKWGKLAKIAAFIHLYRDYREKPLTRFSLDTILRRMPRVLMYFNRLDHGYEPRPYVIQQWNGKSLCYIKFGDNRYVDFSKRNVKNSL